MARKKRYPAVSFLAGMPMKVFYPLWFAALPQFALHCLWGWEYISTVAHLLLLALFPFAYLLGLIMYWRIRARFADGHPVPPYLRDDAPREPEKPVDIPWFTLTFLFSIGFWGCYAPGWYAFLWAVTALLIAYPAVYTVVAILMLEYIRRVEEKRRS